MVHIQKKFNRHTEVQLRTFGSLLAGGDPWSLKTVSESVREKPKIRCFHRIFNMKPPISGQNKPLCSRLHLSWGSKDQKVSKLISKSTEISKWVGQKLWLTSQNDLCLTLSVDVNLLYRRSSEGSSTSGLPKNGVGTLLVQQSIIIFPQDIAFWGLSFLSLFSPTSLGYGSNMIKLGSSNGISAPLGKSFRLLYEVDEAIRSARIQQAEPWQKGHGNTLG